MKEGREEITNLWLRFSLSKTMVIASFYRSAKTIDIDRPTLRKKVKKEREEKKPTSVHRLNRRKSLYKTSGPDSKLKKKTPKTFSLTK